MNEPKRSIARRLGRQENYAGQLTVSHLVSDPPPIGRRHWSARSESQILSSVCTRRGVTGSSTGGRDPRRQSTLPSPESEPCPTPPRMVLCVAQDPGIAKRGVPSNSMTVSHLPNHTFLPLGSSLYLYPCPVETFKGSERSVIVNSGNGSSYQVVLAIVVRYSVS